jgi:AcrR family transcriptional regulator
MSISRRNRKETQRERLLAGMLLAAVRRGYAGANVAQVIAHAGVSRPTFYEYFADKDDCFLAVHREISGQLIQRISQAVSSERPERAVQAGIKALLLFAHSTPERARFLANETMAGGHRALDQRDRLVEQIERVIEHAREPVSTGTLTPDLPTRALVGGIFGLLAPRLRRNEYDLMDLAEEVCGWIDSYNLPSEQHRWRTLTPGPPLPCARHVSELALHPPPALPRGRPSLPSSEIARHQRERIVYAMAEVAAEKGYAAVTIADITTAAGVDRRVFYAHFHDKQQAFLAAHELGFQQTMAVCARAFFSREAWPERIWEGLRAKTHFNATHPVVAHVGYVEAHAVGSPAIQRVDDSRVAYNLFTQEGYRRTSNPPPAIALDAISATIFEICYEQARTQRIDLLPRLTPNAVYLVLAPFLGPEQANEFIELKLSEEQLPQDAAAWDREEVRIRQSNGQDGALEEPMAVSAGNL